MSTRTRLRRHRERGVDDVAERDRILEAATVAHAGMCVEGMPVVIPGAVGRRARSS